MTAYASLATCAVSLAACVGFFVLLILKVSDSQYKAGYNACEIVFTKSANAELERILNETEEQRDAAIVASYDNGDPLRELQRIAGNSNDSSPVDTTTPQNDQPEKNQVFS